MKTKDEMIERYNLLYEKMSDSKNPKNMKIFGEAEKYMFREIAVAHPDMAETWLSHLEIDYVQFYSARHSFATIARNDCGFGKDDIAMCLNHSSGRSVTDSYIKEDYSVIEKVIKGVVKFVFGE